MLFYMVAYYHIVCIYAFIKQEKNTLEGHNKGRKKNCNKFLMKEHTEETEQGFILY